MTERRQRFLALMLEDPWRMLKGAAELAGFADPRRQGSRLMSVPEIRKAVDEAKRVQLEAFRAECKARGERKWYAESIIEGTAPMWARQRRKRRNCM